MYEWKFSKDVPHRYLNQNQYLAISSNLNSIPNYRNNSKIGIFSANIKFNVPPQNSFILLRFKNGIFFPMFHFIRSYIIHFLINRELKTLHRSKQVVNLTNAKSIGIVYSLESETIYHAMNALALQLTKAGAEVKIIGFLSEKIIPNYYLPKLKMDIFTTRDINLLGIPKKPFIKDFINEEFDLLIDLSATDFLSLDYIAGCSHANFKAGRYSDKMVSIFDFMVKKPDDMDAEMFLETMITYLRTINTKQ